MRLAPRWLMAGILACGFLMVVAETRSVESNVAQQVPQIAEKAADTLTYELPKGMSAVAIRNAGTLSMQLKPGDHVDILATYDDSHTKQKTTQMILQNVAVLALNREPAGLSDKGVTNASIMLAVSSEQVELVTAADRTGALSLSLSPPAMVSPPAGVSDEITPSAVLAAMKKAANWQLANPSPRAALDWIQGAGYAGMMALASISDDPKYHDAMMEMARQHEWKPRDPADAAVAAAKRAAEQKREPKPTDYLYHADEHCVMQTYLELYLQHRDPKMLAPSKQRCDQILAAPRDEDLGYTKPHASEKWSWCDALFMSPPAWARLTAATGDKKYLDFVDRNWWLTSNYLYDKDEHLYFRDSTFFNKREANGKKIFWSRGNGWVIAGIVRVLQYLPKDHPSRPRYVQQFRKMADKVLTCQQFDGLWRASLLDPESYPLKESSGSGFFTYALAWGVNQRVLDRAKFYPAVVNAWRALVDCVTPEGKLTYVQPPGADPKKFDLESTEPYGVGAFLLAGSEVYRLAKTPGPMATPAPRVR